MDLQFFTLFRFYFILKVPYTKWFLMVLMFLIFSILLQLFYYLSPKIKILVLIFNFLLLFMKLAVILLINLPISLHKNLQNVHVYFLYQFYLLQKHLLLQNFHFFILFKFFKVIRNVHVFLKLLESYI